MQTEGYYSKATALMEEVVAFKKQQGTGSADVAESLYHLGEFSFFPLNHAKTELEDIGRIMGAERSMVYIGQDALEETEPPPGFTVGDT